MKANLVYAAGLGITAIGTPAAADVRNAELGVLPQASPTAQLSALVGSDEAVNPKAILESSPNAVLDSSGCVNTLADTSGLFGWYAEPVAIPHAAFASSESMGSEVVSAGNTIVALSNTRVAIFENNEQNQPIFAGFTPADGTSPPVRSIAVAPDGLEIVTNNIFTGVLTFYRRGPSGWSGVAAAQVINSNFPAVTYSADGSQLFIGDGGQTTVGGVTVNAGVKIFERDPDGNWQPTTKTVPGKFVGIKSLAWSANRLLVADRNSIVVYKPTVDGFAFSHALGVNFQASWIRPFENGFSANLGGILTIFRFNNSFFSQSFVRNISGSGVAEVQPFVFSSTSRRGSTTLDPCGHVDFFSASNGLQYGSFVLPKGDTIFATTVASGPWGIVVGGVTASGAGEVYLISRDRIFGGQNPPLRLTGAGQGGFE